MNQSVVNVEDEARALNQPVACHHREGPEEQIGPPAQPVTYIPEHGHPLSYGPERDHPDQGSWHSNMVLLGTRIVTQPDR